MILEFVGRFAVGYTLVCYLTNQIKDLPLWSHIIGYILFLLIIIWIILPIFAKDKQNEKENK